jgi:hypothetical protein
MSLHKRLARLEQASNAQRGRLESQSLFDRIAQYEAYLLGNGPRPPEMPCPPGHDPVAWESRMRISRCLALPAGEFLPEMDEPDRQRVADFRQAFANAAIRAESPPVDPDEGLLP